MIEKEQFEHLWDKLLFTKLLQTLRLSVAPARITIALMAVITVCLLGWVMDICTMTVVVNPNQQHLLKPAVSVDQLTNRTELEVYVKEAYLKKQGTSKTFIKRHKKKGKRAGVFVTLWTFGAARFNVATVSLFKLDIGNVFLHIWLCIVALFWAIKYHTVYSIIHFAFVAVIICLGGGAVCRSAALEFARGEKPGFVETLRFSITRFLDFLAGPAISIGMMAFLTIIVILLGLAGSLQWGIGDLIVGLGIAPAMVLGLMTVLMLVGFVAGGGLMFPTIAFEGSNGLEAVSRATVAMTAV